MTQLDKLPLQAIANGVMLGGKFYRFRTDRFTATGNIPGRSNVRTYVHRILVSQKAEGIAAASAMSLLTYIDGVLEAPAELAFAAQTVASDHSSQSQEVNVGFLGDIQADWTVSITGTVTVDVTYAFVDDVVSV